MFPFLVNAPTIEYPLSGDVVQDIEPNFGDQIVGVPEIEREVITRVASYGDQIGALTDAVLALAKKVGLDGDEIAEVQRLSDEVDAAKTRVRGAIKARAEIALRKLEVADPEGHARVLSGSFGSKT